MFTINIHVCHLVNEINKPGRVGRGGERRNTNQKPIHKEKKTPQLYQVDTAATDTVPGIS